MQENRLARVEAQLSGRQRVLAWMHRQQQLGGYMQMVMVVRELRLNYLISKRPSCFTSHWTATWRF